MKYTLKDIEKKQAKMKCIRNKYNLLSEIDKLSDNGLKIGRMLNRAIKEYRDVKCSFFYGNN